MSGGGSDVEHRPILVLSHVLALVTFLGALALSGPLTRDEQGLTAADRTLCTMFKGRVCFDVAALTHSERAQAQFVSFTCEGDMTRDCVETSVRVLGFETAETFFSAACEDGSIFFCVVVAYGAEAADFAELECRKGEAWACTHAGYIYEQGRGIERDTARAEDFFEAGCDGGDGAGCSRLGSLHLARLPPDSSEARRLYRLACDAGDERGCSNLATLLARQREDERDAAEAERLYRKACESGREQPCDLEDFSEQ